MRLYSTELYGRLSCTECCHHEDILCCGDSEIGSDEDILAMVFSLESDILTFTHVLISVALEGM